MDTNDITDGCGECRFWHRTERGAKYEPDKGVCRRHAPVPLIVPGRGPDDDVYVQPLWPSTDTEDWCGEFEQRP